MNLLLTEIESYHNGKRAPIVEQMEMFPDADVAETILNKETHQVGNGDDAKEETPEELDARIKREIEEGTRHPDGRKKRGRKKKEKTDDELNNAEE